MSRPFKHIQLSMEGLIARLRLNRPERHNSLVPEMLEEILEALSLLRVNPEPRVLLLSAPGRCFSTGGDLAAFLAHWDAIDAYARRIVGALNQVVLGLRELDIPVVVAAQGWTTGGSMGLILAADIVLLSEDARFAPYYCEVGFAPDGGWSCILPARIGPARAAEAQYRNRVISAAEALEWGLANRVVATAALVDTAEDTVAAIAAKQPSTLRATKRLLRGDLSAWRAGLDAELEAFVENVQQPGVHERVQAFVAALHGA